MHVKQPICSQKLNANHLLQSSRGKSQLFLYNNRIRKSRRRQIPMLQEGHEHLHGSLEACSRYVALYHGASRQYGQQNRLWESCQAISRTRRLCISSEGRHQPGQETNVLQKFQRGKISWTGSLQIPMCDPRWYFLFRLNAKDRRPTGQAQSDAELCSRERPGLDTANIRDQSLTVDSSCAMGKKCYSDARR